MPRERGTAARQAHPPVSRWAEYDATLRSTPPPRGLVVRPTEAADRSAVAWIEAAREGVDSRSARGRDERDRKDSSGLLLVADVDGRVVGFGRAGFIRRGADAGANALPEGWYLLGVVVVDSWRRRGIGRSLTNARLDWIAERADRVRYFANARNLASIRLHASLGFVEVTRDFAAPGVTFEGGEGVLCALDLRREPG